MMFKKLLRQFTASNGSKAILAAANKLLAQQFAQSFARRLAITGVEQLLRGDKVSRALRDSNLSAEHHAVILLRATLSFHLESSDFLSANGRLSTRGQAVHRLWCSLTELAYERAYITEQEWQASDIFVWKEESTLEDENALVNARESDTRSAA